MGAPAPRVGLVVVLAFFFFFQLIALDTLTQTKNHGAIAHVPEQQNSTSCDTIANDDKETGSACLLVMDDNHYIIEWLAYHYHVLPLRHVVVAVDPRSQTSPSKIFDRWRGRMTIEEWDDSRFTPVNFTESFTGPSKDRDTHVNRQRLFNLECLRHLKKLDKGWVLVADSDEYTRINPFVLNPHRRIYDPNRRVPPIEEPGSVLTFLNHLLVPDPKFQELTTPCVPIVRHPFSARESPVKKVNADVPDGFDGISFQTLRWRYWKSKRRHDYKSQVWNKTCNLLRSGLPGKTIIDLKRLRLQDLYHPSHEGNPHRPLKTICPFPFLAEPQHPLTMHHYMGTMDQSMYRSDNRGVGFRLARYEFQNNTVGTQENDDVRGWLKAFVESVGSSEAAGLLEGVGELEPVNQRDWRQEVYSNSTAEHLYQVGDEVQVKTPKQKEWFRTEVIKVHTGGFCDLLYDDCTVDFGVPADQIRRTDSVIEAVPTVE